MRPLNIAIAVHGRWDAFDLARELDGLGHRVTLLTNYPRWAVERNGFRGRIRSFWPHGVLTRAVARLPGPRLARAAEPALHRLFGRWAAGVLRRASHDVVYVFSGVAEEALRELEGRSSLRFLVRESAHIRVQDQLLRDEQVRTGAPQDRPSRWMIGREEREYASADLIRVLSSFAYDSFLKEGMSPKKLRLVLSGVQLSTFRPKQEDVEVRCERLAAGGPLRVLNVGTFAFRKGVWDSAQIIRELDSNRFDFRFVGPVATEAVGLAHQLEACATFVAKQPQGQLPAAYAWGDVFMLPTIEDGYAAVLAQAAAAGLPILTTPNGAGRDLVHENESGWILPVRAPQAFAERLRWADTHRGELASMVRNVYAEFQPRDFHEVAVDFEQTCMEYLNRG
jgi:glycosyltransferase involved in cell wall biosynthesis